VALLCVLGTALQGAEIPKPSGSAIVAADSKLELVYTREPYMEGGLTEGPAVAPDGSVYFSDITFGNFKGRILRYEPKTGKTTVFADDSGKSNGLTFDADGFLVAAEGADYGGRRISRWNVKTGERATLADGYQGKRFNSPNDIALDSKGRFYFSDPRYLGNEPRELDVMAVFRVDRDGTVVEVTHDVTKPNGVGLSPDEKTLYVAEHNNGSERITDPNAPPGTPGAMKIYAFPLGPDGLVQGERKTIVDFGEGPGCDGMTVDEKGNVYLTSRSASRPGVMVVNPEGREVGFIPTGSADQKAGAAVGLPSNVEFGHGDQAKILYITVDRSLYRIPLKVRGYHPQYR
jgi:gluconolactonase